MKDGDKSKRYAYIPTSEVKVQNSALTPIPGRNQDSLVSIGSNRSNKLSLVKGVLPLL